MDKEEIIEPSEIIVDYVDDEAKDYTHVSPWNRFLSRMLDYSLFEILIYIIISLAFPSLSFSRYGKFIAIEFLLWVPIEALLLSTWGYTPGKFLLKTTLRKHFNKKLDFQDALRRSFSVWFRGIGLGIPIVNIFAMFFAFSRLKTQGITSWDRDEKITVTHHPVGVYRFVIALIVIILSSFIII